MSYLRYNFKLRAFLVCVTAIVFSFLFNKVAYAGSQEPIFSTPAGLYTEAFELTITSPDRSAKIYYTIDGSVPEVGQSTTKEYTTPIKIGYTAVRETPSNYFCGTVIRAIAVGADGTASKTSTASYFVDKDILNRYKLPIISITTKSDNLFDSSIGIMAPGNTQQKGMDWERPIHFEYFDTGGKQQISMDAGIRLHGAASRDWVFKSFRIYGRSEYDTTDKFEFNFFEKCLIQPIVKNGDNKGTPITEFKRLILRNGGNEGTANDGTFIRDNLSQTLMANTTLDLQAYEPTVVFLNGEFYGIENIQEREDEKYIADHYNVEEKDIALYEFAYNEQGAMKVIVSSGDDSDISFYDTMNQFLKTQDLSVKENYEKVKTWVDIENFVDYQIINLYGANDDWPGNNCKTWRVKTEYYPNADYGLDGRLRYLVYDQDFNFGLYNPTKISKDMIAYATQVAQISWPNPEDSTLLFRKLLENEEFKTYFCQRFLDLLNTNFDPTYVNSVIDQLSAPYKTAIDEFRNRFHTMGDYDANINFLKIFVNKRGDICKSQLANHFDLGSLYFLSITMVGSSNQALGGKVKVNTVTLDANAKGVQDGLWRKSYYQGLPTTITAIPDEGYEFVSWSGSSTSTDSALDASTIYNGTDEVKLTPVFRKVKASNEDNQISSSGKSNNSTSEQAVKETFASVKNASKSKDNVMYLLSFVFLFVIILAMVSYWFIHKRKGKKEKPD